MPLSAEGEFFYKNLIIFAPGTHLSTYGNILSDSGACWGSCASCAIGKYQKYMGCPRRRVWRSELWVQRVPGGGPVMSRGPIITHSGVYLPIIIGPPLL
jgi:hypothetical protein